MLHPYAWVDGWFSEPLETDTGQRAGIVSLEFGRTRATHNFVRGFKLQLSVGAPAPGVQFDAAQTGGKDSRVHAAGLSISAEDLPEEANRIVLSSASFDNDGLPVPRMIYQVSANSREMLDYGIEKATDVLKTAGAVTTVATPLKVEAGFHLMGTARMGRDPRTSVLNGWNQVWDAPNVFVTDGSGMTSAACQNPSLTYMAMTARAADHAVNELKRRNL